LIFDLEIVILFPWIVFLHIYDIYQYVSILIFLLLLTIGFVFEWKKGALDWI
jgi:NADH-quinone oxidoreductase subunit A